jgi:transcription termination factor Rho
MNSWPRSGYGGPCPGTGVLEVLQDGFGFLRSVDYNYLPKMRATKASGYIAPMLPRLLPGYLS